MTLVSDEDTMSAPQWYRDLVSLPEPDESREDESREDESREDEFMEDDPLEDETGGGEGDEEQPSMTVGEFIDFYKEAITNRVIESYPPRYNPREQEEPLPRLLRRPMGAQEHAVRGTALSLKLNQGTTVVGEMGTGKTYIGAASAHMAGFKNILVMCPPHLIEKWKREILMTIPGAQARIVSSIPALRQLARDGKRKPGDPPHFAIMSREMSKLSYRWEASYVVRADPDQGGKAIMACPDCFNQIRDGRRIPLRPYELNRKFTKCRECGGALWKPMQMGHVKKCRCPQCGGDQGNIPQPKNRQYPLSRYIGKHMKNFFDLLICDEVHEYKGKGTGQGIAAGNLASYCGRVMTLTGTLMGGYSSTIFHLLYRFSPDIRVTFGHRDESRWIDLYGFRQQKVIKDDGQSILDGRGSIRREYRKPPKETPGLAPAALFHIIGNAVFIRLSDVSSGLPPYEEQVMVHPMSEVQAPEDDESQASAYREVYQKMRAALLESIQNGSNRLLGKYLQTLLSYPDACTKGEVVTDPDDPEENIVDMPPLDPGVTYPKEQALIDLILAEKALGRRVLVYVSHTETRDITPRMEEFLNRNNIRTAVLKSGSPDSKKREAWVERRVKEGVDAIICNPRLVQTGLDLVDFPTICWYETDYSVYTMRQASRRSWRIGQDRPVRVIFMVYEDTIQTDALKLIARKMQSSLAVEGELPEEGLTAFGDDSQDLIMTLAKQIVNDERMGSSDSLEGIFARARDADRENERYLMDDEWDVPGMPGIPGPEAPEPPETETQPEIELETQPELEAQPEPEAQPELQPELVAASTQPSIFSWAEFLAEPQEKNTRRKPKPRPAPSLFQWAAQQEETSRTTGENA